MPDYKKINIGKTRGRFSTTGELRVIFYQQQNERMKKEKILVTGGLGFIGSHTVVELIRAGYNVVIIDDLSNARLPVLDNIERITGTRPLFYKSDMTDRYRLIHLLKDEQNIDAVIHFAAFKAVGESISKPLKYFRNNLFSLINILECMKLYGIHHFVFSSSATVYGEPDDLPVNELSVCKPALSAYGSTKQMGEEIIQKTAMAGLVNAISLRYFNPVGAHPSGLLGEMPAGIPNNLMPLVTQTAAGIRERLIVYGDDYDTPDGTCIRDYIHVTDLARAHVKSCMRLLQKGTETGHEIFNIGTGKGISVLEIIGAFEKYTGVKINYQIGKRRAGDAASVYADVSLAKKLLHWEAEKGIREMVMDAWNWQQKSQQDTTHAQYMFSDEAGGLAKIGG